jgi:hypothetical protein
MAIIKNTNDLVRNGDTTARSYKSILKHIGLSALFVGGIYTTMIYFFSFIGIIIGILYFLLIKDNLWKKLGLILAWTAGISTLIVNGAALRNTTLAPSISTTYLNLLLGPLMIIMSVAAIFAWEKWIRNNVIEKRWFYKLQNFRMRLSKTTKVFITIIVILMPGVFWWVISVNLSVMFDNEARLLWVHAPTTVRSGSDFDVIIEAWDPHERLSATYRGTVEFSIKSYHLTNFAPLSSVSATLPSKYTFTGQFFGSDVAYEIRDGKDNGLHVFTAQINTVGIHYILVYDSFTENTYWSNPIIVDNFADTDPKIYWGDIHTHSALSDGSGLPEHHFFYARYVACLDFNAMTDHGETMGILIGGLDTSEYSANSAYEAGEFVTFPGIEWTSAVYGHFTCIFSEDKLIKNPVISFFVITTPQQLWDALDNFTNSTGCRALALPHHTIKEEYPQDWTYINPKYVRIAEVTSVHGESLFEHRNPYNYIGCLDPPPVYTNGTAIMDAFKMGYRLALYGSSDEHDGHPGHSLSHTDAYIGHQRPWTTWVNRADLPYPGSLTAVYANNLTRELVFDGLYNQKIFANSDHGRPILTFSINGVDMIDLSNNCTLYVSSPSEVRNIEVFLAQDGAPAANKRPNVAFVTPNWLPNWDATIEIFKNGELLNATEVSGPINKITIQDEAVITGTSFEDKCVKKADGKYYINDYSDNPIDPSDLNTGGADFYVVRVVGDNGRMTYAGPIWVEVST